MRSSVGSGSSCGVGAGAGTGTWPTTGGGAPEQAATSRARASHESGEDSDGTSGTAHAFVRPFVLGEIAWSFAGRPGPRGTSRTGIVIVTRWPSDAWSTGLARAGTRG